VGVHAEAAQLVSQHRRPGVLGVHDQGTAAAQRGQRSVGLRLQPEAGQGPVAVGEGARHPRVVGEPRRRGRGGLPGQRTQDGGDLGVGLGDLVPGHRVAHQRGADGHADAPVGGADEDRRVQGLAAVVVPAEQRQDA
jgi:hypothetical protein